MPWWGGGARKWVRESGGLSAPSPASGVLSIGETFDLVGSHLPSELIGRDGGLLVVLTLSLLGSLALGDMYTLQHAMGPVKSIGYKF